ncbi:MAG: hypothetical protein J7L71_12160, partial [Spirochaetaceae bacterium]|nr:hypothetical protein [Spirochaetaceae bacterium]
IENHGDFETSFIRRYTILWQTFQMFLLIVLLSNNIGFMWVSLEATTLISAFLIISPSNPLSIEAMWKYLIVCSVGIVFGFMGTILTVVAAQNNSTEPLFLFTQLVEYSDLINPKIILLAFIFIIVGFGTKAGLAPMHTWLPDAHSQAPSPVSAVFSGVMLNVALFGIMRYLSVTDLALGNDGQAQSILLIFGFISLLITVIFIPIQHDIKRLLAYHSVEHMGIIAIGLGLGGPGTFAALFHITNHSLSKVLAFFSAGHISEYYGTRDMRKIKAAVHTLPIWGITFFVAMLVLIGVAPFAVFLSELLILKEAFFTNRYLIVILFLFGTFAVFISALKHSLDVSFGSNMNVISDPLRISYLDKIIVFSCIAVLLILGLWIPEPFAALLRTASEIIQNGVRL